MKTRNIAMLCTAMVMGTAAAAAPTAVTAETLRAPVIRAQAASASASTTRTAASKASTVDPVEARIKDLHARLRITPAQEDLWQRVTEVMRENATTMDAFRKARSEKAQTLTAVEDFKSYAEITEAHADGIKKFVPVFSALYDSMSEAQKTNADTIFRHGSAQRNAASR